MEVRISSRKSNKPSPTELGKFAQILTHKSWK